MLQSLVDDLWKDIFISLITFPTVHFSLYIKHGGTKKRIFTFVRKADAIIGYIYIVI